MKLWAFVLTEVLVGVALLAWVWRGTLLKPVFWGTDVALFGYIPGNDVRPDGTEIPWYSDEAESPNKRCYFGMMMLTDCVIQGDGWPRCERLVDEVCVNLYPNTSWRLPSGHHP